MEPYHLEDSDFRRLKLVHCCSTFDGDCDGGGDAGGCKWFERPYSLRKLFQQCKDFFKKNPRLASSFGDVDDDDDKEVEDEDDDHDFSVGRLLAQPSIVTLIDKFISSHGDDKKSGKKNAVKSVDYRTRGKQDYALGQLVSAGYYYTMAIVYAPNVDLQKPNDGPDALSLAYGKRSAVFFKLGNYEACLADIDKAFATGHPRVKHAKLLIRKVECLMALERHLEAYHVWKFWVAITSSSMKEEPGSVSIETLARMRPIAALLLNTINARELPPGNRQYDLLAPSAVPSKSADPDQWLSIITYLSDTGRYEQSTSLPPLSAKLEPRTTAKGNRFLVASRDIAPGELLVVESPFVSILDRKYEFHFCHHCCRRLEVEITVPLEITDKEDEEEGQEEEEEETESSLCIGCSSVPCTHCTRVLYCSTACRTTSWHQYHQFECAILPVLHEIANFGRLALRTLLVTGLDAASEVASRNVVNEEEEQVRMPDFNNPKEVEANYENVYRLSLPKRDSPPPPEFAQFQLATTVMVRALMKQSAFVRTYEEAKLAGTIVARHFVQAYFKSHKISSRISLHRDSPINVQVGERPFTIGLGFYPYLASAWRHSCDPNTKHTYVNGNLMIYRATKCIPVGTEVTISLGASFVEKDLKERQEALWKQYGFKCDCAKCVLESRDGLDGKYFPIGCKDCGSTLTRTSSTSTSFNCTKPSCTTVMSLSTVKDLYARAASHLTFLNGLCDIDSGSINTSPITIRRLVKGADRLEQLSAMKGMANYCRLSLLYYKLSCLFAANAHENMDNYLQYYERHVAIAELNSGTCDEVYLMFVNLVNMYGWDAASSVKRALEWTRLFALADARDESTAPDVLVDGSRYCWMVEKTLLPL